MVTVLLMFGGFALLTLVGTGFLLYYGALAAKGAHAPRFTPPSYQPMVMLTHKPAAAEAEAASPKADLILSAA